jgi:predicted aldo/keto reductase-like oxidoreductase
MQIALRALKNAYSFIPMKMMEHHLQAEDALRDRLAQPEREWVGLTEDEAIELLPVGEWEVESTLDFAKAIDAKLKEKNS